MTFEHIISLDHGNGWFKGRSKDKRIVLPSLIATSDKLGKGAMGKQLNIKPYKSNLDRNNIYLWGEDIKKLNGTVSTYAQQDRYEQLEYQILSEIAMLELLGEGDIFNNVLVVTGVPSKEIGTKAEEQLIKALEGAHVVNGKVINVSKVEVIPQPFGTVMSLVLDEEGYLEKSQYETARVGIIDIGTGTTDLDVIESLVRQNETTSISHGMHDVYNTISGFINQENPNANATPIKVEKYFKDDYYNVSERVRIDISKVKDFAIHDTFAQLKQGINLLWKSLDTFDEIILTGGGASTFEKNMRGYLKDFTIPKDSQFSNAEGYYKYGMYVKGVVSEQNLSTSI